MTMFHVGQKVCCVSGGKGNLGAADISHYTKPRRGGIYTIATLNNWPRATILTFIECDNSHLIAELGCKYEPGFDAKYFRPIVSRTTDISIFTAMLNPSKQGVDA